VKKKIICFAVNNLKQVEELISATKQINLKTVIFIKYYIVSGFGADWIRALTSILIKSSPRNSFKLFVDCHKDCGLAIELIKLKIDYIKINSNTVTLKKINQIAEQNKVLLNPSFHIVDLSNIKNIKKKICKIKLLEKK